ncbi:N-acetyltransferase family protein [Actinomadura sp. KC06]|uniref:GNAT family N-acetyltransferase n=1 Tax=Actinomadura sp. KC06 TaxID=2530369 RepID=UPI001048DEBB|nr:GNAT family N-acetyltransferase [Actinomadura sp. KC06]TDD33156.1 N-acetyltransferase family protein [Actinomadura sp. KC06]
MSDQNVPTVRPAQPRDLEAIARIYAHYVLNTTVTFEQDPPDAHDWWRRLDAVQARGLPFLVAEQTGKVMGFAYCKPWRTRSAYRRTVEDSVYLMPEAVGRGMGRTLLEALLRDCAAAGIRQVIAVIVETGDPTSSALHKSCGFVDAGRLSAVGHKHGRWLDTLMLQRALP